MFLSNLLAFLTLLGGLLLVFFMYTLFHRLVLKKPCPCTPFTKRNAVKLSLIVALVATLGSLYYSEVLGYEPCKLCWFQRILMYPIALILWLSLIIKDKKVLNYTFLLSLIGAPISLYHYFLQQGFVTEIKCSTVGYSVSCADKYVMQYGYITLPMMAFTAFSLILFFSGIGLFVKLKEEKKQ